VAYTRGTDLSGSLEGAGGIGGLLARSHGYSGGSWGTHSFYHADGGGNVTYLVNSSQTRVAEYRYDPYGRALYTYDSLPSGGNRYRFSSKELVTGGNLYYYGYRFYDPNLQRWVNPDPLGEAGSGLIRQLMFSTRTTRGRAPGEVVQSPNLYSFVLNNPLVWADLFGLVIVNDGPDAAFWQHYLNCWKTKLPTNSPLRQIVADLEKSKHSVRINPLKGETDIGGKQLSNPQTLYDQLSGNSTMWIDPKSHIFRGRKYSTSEGLAHELLHAHDHLVNTANRGRGHEDGFMNEERILLDEVEKCK
jgi:RHS repeat-associated protein